MGHGFAQQRNDVSWCSVHLERLCVRPRKRGKEKEKKRKREEENTVCSLLLSTGEHTVTQLLRSPHQILSSTCTVGLKAKGGGLVQLMQSMVWKMDLFQEKWCDIDIATT